MRRRGRRAGPAARVASATVTRGQLGPSRRDGWPGPVPRCGVGGLSSGGEEVVFLLPAAGGSYAGRVPVTVTAGPARRDGPGPGARGRTED